MINFFSFHLTLMFWSCLVRLSLSFILVSTSIHWDLLHRSVKELIFKLKSVSSYNSHFKYVKLNKINLTRSIKSIKRENKTLIRTEPINLLMPKKHYKVILNLLPRPLSKLLRVVWIHITVRNTYKVKLCQRIVSFFKYRYFPYSHFHEF